MGVLAGRTQTGPLVLVKRFSVSPWSTLGRVVVGARGWPAILFRLEEGLSMCKGSL